jgi:hypothetical protein
MKNVKLKNLKIEDSYTLFIWGFGWDHKNELKLQENVKSGFYCVFSGGC